LAGDRRQAIGKAVPLPYRGRPALPLPGASYSQGSPQVKGFPEKDRVALRAPFSKKDDESPASRTDDDKISETEWMK
jgi:hypothetical protein